MIAIAALEGFYWVARTGGYTAAARSFPYPITQPGVHKQVRRVEAELGVKLFERIGGTGVALTPAGERLYEFAAPFFEELPAVAQGIARGGYGGRLRIEAPGLVVSLLLPAWLRRLHRERPDITVEVRQVDVLDLRRLGRDTDLVVDFLPEAARDVEARSVGSARVFVVLPQGYPLAQRRKIDIPTLATLGSKPFVSYTSDLPHARLQARALELAGIAPKMSAAASTAETIVALVSAGLGFSLVPWLGPRGPRAPGMAAVPLDAPEATFPISAAWRRRSAPNPLIEEALSRIGAPRRIGTVGR
jgi:DNA-binding transcriptional LysR family regulator